LFFHFSLDLIPLLLLISTFGTISVFPSKHLQAKNGFKGICGSIRPIRRIWVANGGKYLFLWNSPKEKYGDCHAISAELFSPKNYSD
jgi:hypothetical protein